MTTFSDFLTYFGIPTSFHKHMQNPVDLSEEAKKQSIEWMKSEEPFCILSGSNGTGKTTIACKMMVSWFEENRHKDPSVQLVRSTYLYQQWLDEMRSGSVKRLLDKYCEYDLIILDDIGVKKMPTEGWREWLICLIDYRMDWMKKTIITTNLNANEIKKCYGETMLSRLLMGTQIKILGKDRRLKEK